MPARSIQRAGEVHRHCLQLKDEEHREWESWKKLMSVGEELVFSLRGSQQPQKNTDLEFNGQTRTVRSDHLLLLQAALPFASPASSLVLQKKKKKTPLCQVKTVKRHYSSIPHTSDRLAAETKLTLSPEKYWRPKLWLTRKSSQCFYCQKHTCHFTTGVKNTQITFKQKEKCWVMPFILTSTIFLMLF